MQLSKIFIFVLSAILLGCNAKESEDNAKESPTSDNQGGDVALTDYSKSLPLDKIKLPDGFKI